MNIDEKLVNVNGFCHSSTDAMTDADIDKLIDDNLLMPVTESTESNDQPVSLQTLLDSLAAAVPAKSKTAAWQWSLDHVDEIATLNQKDMARLFTRLVELGATKSWIKADLMPLLRQAAKQTTDDVPAYIERDNVIYVHMQKIDERAAFGEYVALSNFTARVTADILRDNGQETERFIEIGGKLWDGTQLPAIQVKSTEFTDMKWAIGQWGARVSLATGRWVADHVRKAIQELSEGKYGERRVYTHTGWREIDGRWAFLHASGAIGADDVTVELPSELVNYTLPVDDSVYPVEAMRASVALLDSMPTDIVYPLYAAIFLAPLSEFLSPNFTTWTEGRSGAGKTTVNALMLSHFGPNFDHDSVPATWRGTDNSLEQLTFHAKNIPLLIDDYKPQTNHYDKQRSMGAVQRIVEAVSSRQGKSRMGQATYAPRGVVMSTAEISMGGLSNNARLLTVRLDPGDLNFEKIGQCQANAHLYSYAMTGFIRYIAENWDALAAQLPATMKDERATIKSAHARLSTTAATIITAFSCAMSYAVQIGAISQAAADDHIRICREVVVEAVAAQDELVAAQDPALEFLQTLVTMLRQRQIKFEQKFIDNAARQEAEKKGDPLGLGGYYGEVQGWCDSASVYLLPSAYNAVSLFAHRQGRSFAVDERDLRRALRDSGYLATGSSNHIAVVRRDVDGAQKRVIEIDANSIFDVASEMNIKSDDLFYDANDQGDLSDNAKRVS